MEQAIADALEIITGNKSGGYYLAGFAFSFLTILLSIYLHSKKKFDPEKHDTPTRFSWLFMIWDNFKRAVAGLILMFLIFRLFDCSNVAVMMGVGFFVSFGVDKAIQFLMDKTDFMNFLKTNRDNFPQKPTDNATS